MTILLSRIAGRNCTKCIVPRSFQIRSFWEYVNMMFNKPDPARIKQVGPDRACAEWVLRNGGKVMWADGKKLSDYNALPTEGQSTLKILEIDGTDSSISHYGFPHLSGCTMLQKVILHNCRYIDNRAMQGFVHGKETINHVQLSKCVDITDAGVKELEVLSKLKTLVLFNLERVQNIDECKQYLQASLPNCKIQEK